MSHLKNNKWYITVPFIGLRSKRKYLKWWQGRIVFAAKIDRVDIPAFWINATIKYKQWKKRLIIKN